MCEVSRIAQQRYLSTALDGRLLRFIPIVSQKCDGRIDAIAWTGG